MEEVLEFGSVEAGPLGIIWVSLDWYGFSGVDVVERFGLLLLSAYKAEGEYPNIYCLLPINY